MFFVDPQLMAMIESVARASIFCDCAPHKILTSACEPGGRGRLIRCEHRERLRNRGKESDGGGERTGSCGAPGQTLEYSAPTPDTRLRVNRIGSTVENLAKGQTGLSMTFDLPTQTELDSDHPLARGEVGEGRRGDLSANGGMPAIAKVAMNMVQCVMGMRLCRSPILRMSCSPLMAWITEPDPRNSSALKKACVKTWKTPAENAPTPRARNMYPNCETVE